MLERLLLVLVRHLLVLLQRLGHRLLRRLLLRMRRLLPHQHCLQRWLRHHWRCGQTRRRRLRGQKIARLCQQPVQHHELVRLLGALAMPWRRHSLPQKHGMLLLGLQYVPEKQQRLHELEHRQFGLRLVVLLLLQPLRYRLLGQTD